MDKRRDDKPPGWQARSHASRLKSGRQVKVVVVDYNQVDTLGQPARTAEFTRPMLAIEVDQTTGAILSFELVFGRSDSAGAKISEEV